MEQHPAPRTTSSPPPKAPPGGARSVVLVVLDSLRWDSWTTAEPENLGRLAPVERRWSYASWTAPSHYNLMTGLLPHDNPRRVYASEHYKQEFERYGERLGVPEIDFKAMLPGLWLPGYLRDELGYETGAMVSMPVLNRHTGINRGFGSYELMPKHNDMAAMVDRLEVSPERPSFHLLNVGETHYPYALPGEDPSEWPRVHGVHGVFKHMGDETAPANAEAEGFFDRDALDRLRERQIEAVRYLDGVFARLFDKLPSGTWVIVTSDHGELFGEDDFFGHGPIVHEKVFEVPFAEGLVP